MLFTLSLFLLGVLGFVLNKKNLIVMLISIEIMLLSVTLLFVLSSSILDEVLGQTFGIFILCLAGAETALGLGLVVSYYRLRGNIVLQK